MLWGKSYLQIAKKAGTAFIIVLLLAFLLQAFLALDASILFYVSGYLQWAVPVLGGVLIYIAGAMFMRKLKKTEKLKSDFVTVAAHRLRTPLTRIAWMVGGLESEVQTQEGKGLIADANKTIKELTGIVNQFLDAMEAGDDALYNEYLFEEGSLTQVARQALTDYAVGIQRKELEVAVDIKEGLPRVPLDKDHMRIAIGILLENAVLYTPRGGKISVTTLLKDRKNIAIEIVDNGIGISKEEMPNLFSKFYRGKRATSIDPDRAGLGLFIAQEIVKKHGGRVEAGSLGTSHGSRFAIILPVAR